MRYSIFLVLLSIFLYGCGEQATTEVKEIIEAQKPWLMQVETIDLSDPECKDEECTFVNLAIPVLSGGETSTRSAINSAIDKAVRESLSSKLPEPAGRSSISEMSQSFIEGHKLFKLEFPDTDEIWFAKIDGSESALADTIFTLRLDFMDYMGGAHPNSYTLLKTFLLSTGDELDVTSLMAEGELLSKAEEEFRQKYDLDPETNLEEAGFMFENNTFALPKNMALVEGGILLHYNPYEVASYAQGATEFLIEL